MDVCAWRMCMCLCVRWALHLSVCALSAYVHLMMTVCERGVCACVRLITIVCERGVCACVCVCALTWVHDMTWLDTMCLDMTWLVYTTSHDLTQHDQTWLDMTCVYDLTWLVYPGLILICRSKSRRRSVAVVVIESSRIVERRPMLVYIYIYIYICQPWYYQNPLLLVWR